jgi:hypothetical protein
MNFFSRRDLSFFLSTIQVLAALDKATSQPSCGQWQQDYKKIHEDIVKGVTPPRFAVAVIPHTGFSGSLLASMFNVVKQHLILGYVT